MNFQALPDSLIVLTLDGMFTGASRKFRPSVDPSRAQQHDQWNARVLLIVYLCFLYATDSPRLKKFRSRVKQKVDDPEIKEKVVHSTSLFQPT